MAKLSRFNLIGSKFTVYNLDRYSSNPTDHSHFVGLTDDDLIFEDVVIGAVTVPDRSATIRSTTKGLIGHNQVWKARLLAQAVDQFDYEQVPVAAAQLDLQTYATPGVYRYLDGNGIVNICVVLPKGAPTGPAARGQAVVAILMDKLKIACVSTDIVAGPTVAFVLVTHPVFYGRVGNVVSTVDP